MSEQITTKCPCGANQVLRTNSENGSEFMGCSRYPDCTETSKVPAWLTMKRAGAMELPGLDGGA